MSEAIQMPLLSVPESDAFHTDGNHLHTAERLKLHNSGKYQAIKEALEGGCTITGLAKAYHVSVNTIYAVINTEFGGVAKWKESLSEKLALGAHLAVERVIDLIPKEKSSTAAAMVAGILMDKQAMITGAPSIVIEHRHVQSAAIEKFTELLNAAKEKMANARVLEPLAIPA